MPGGPRHCLPDPRVLECIVCVLGGHDLRGDGLGGGANLRIETLYLVQSTQTRDGTVPLVAGKDAYLRVFVVAGAGASFSN